MANIEPTGVDVLTGQAKTVRSTDTLYVSATAGTSNLQFYTGPPAISFSAQAQTDYMALSSNIISTLNAPSPRGDYSFLVVNETDSASANNVAVYGYAQTTHTGTKSLVHGVEGNVYNTGSGDIANISGVVGFAGNDGSGTVDRASSFRAWNATNAGTLTDNVGLFINDRQNVGTNRYAIYYDHASPFVVRGDGSVGIGTISPSTNTSLQINKTDTTTVPTVAYTYTEIEIDPSSDLGSNAQREASQAYIFIPDTNANDMTGRLVGNTVYTENNGTGDIGAVWGYNAYIANYANTTVAQVLGIFSQGYNSAGTVLSVEGAEFSSVIDGGTVTHSQALKITSNATAGTITNFEGVHVDNLANTGATITNRYVVRADAPSGAATNEYGIFIEGSTRTNYLQGKLGIGISSPATSAALEVSTTTGAVLLPRMNTTQRDALTAVNGMLIYNSQTNKFQGYENGAWTNLI